MWVCLHTCTWMHMDDGSIQCVSLLLFTVYFSGRVSTEPGAHQFSKPSWLARTRVSSFYTSTAGITGACHHTQLSHGCSELRSLCVLGKHFSSWSCFLSGDALLCVQRKRCSESVKSGQFANYALLAHCCLCVRCSLGVTPFRSVWSQGILIDYVPSSVENCMEVAWILVTASWLNSQHPSWGQTH